MLPQLFITIVTVGVISAAMTVCAGGLLVLRLRYRTRIVHHWSMPPMSHDTATQDRIARFLKELRNLDR